MLQAFHTDVANVDRDVSYVAMIVRVCCRPPFFNVLSFFPDTCCKCGYSNAAHVFYIYVAKCFYLNVVFVCNGFHLFFMCFFISISDARFKCFICLQAYVSNVASGCSKSRLEVLHMLQQDPPSTATLLGRH